MHILPIIVRLHPELDADQLEIIAHEDGPCWLPLAPVRARPSASSSTP